MLFDGANPRQLELDANTKQVRATAVLVRTPLHMTVRAGGRQFELLRRIRFDQGG